MAGDGESPAAQLLRSLDVDPDALLIEQTAIAMRPDTRTPEEIEAMQQRREQKLGRQAEHERSFRQQQHRRRFG